MRFDIHIHGQQDMPGWAQHCLLPLVYEILGKVKTMSIELDRLTQEVGEMSTAVDSVLTLVEGLAEQIRQNAENPVKLKALADELDAKQAAIAAAVEANTVE